MTTVSIIGAGAWGLALASMAERSQKKVMVYAYDNQEFECLKHQRQTPHLPDVQISNTLEITNDLSQAARANIILVAVPAQNMRHALEALRVHLHTDSYLIICSKGIELNSGLLMTQVAQQVLPDHSISVFSGPTFAADVIADLPALATISSFELTTSRWLASSLSNNRMRLFVSTDCVGMQIIGALKNVIAIASGALMGQNFGESARAGLIAFGLIEVQRLGLALGAHAETFLNPGALGDLMLTATSHQSRNYALGLSLHKMDQSKSSPSNKLTEGAFTARAVVQLALAHNVDMPVCRFVCKILDHPQDTRSELEIFWSKFMKND